MSISSNAVDFKRLCNLIHQHCGLDFDDRRWDFVLNRVQKRLGPTRCADTHEYLGYIQLPAKAAELQALCESLTTNETYFFREYPQLTCFADHILQDLCEEKRRRGEYILNIWSAACSTGEEPYTLAIILAECLEDYPKWSIHIHATDISVEVLRKARLATYEGRAIQYIPRPYLLKHFDRHAESWSVRENIRRLVKFDQVNFLDAGKMSRYGSMDFVFCRNVMIYFDKEGRRQVVERLHKSLLPAGYLFVGHSESLTDHLDLFDQVRRGGILQYRNREGSK